MKKLQRRILKKLPSSLYKQMKLLIFIILLMLVITYILNIRYIASSNERNVKVLNNKMMSQIEDELEIFSETMNHIAASLTYSPSAYEYFTMDEINRVIYAEELTSIFLNTTMMEDDIKQICLYDADGNLIAGSEEFWSQEELDGTNLEKDKVSFGDVFVSESNGLGYYTVSFPVFDLSDKNYGTQIGSSLFVMRTASLEAMMQDMGVTKSSQMFLLDANGEVVASYGNELNESLEEIRMHASGQYYVEERETAMDGWKIVSVIPQNEIIFGSLGLYANTTVAYMSVALLMLILLIFINRWIIHPLGRMDSFIKNILSEPNKRMETERIDEIGTVIHSLNRMLDEKEVLQNNIHESQKQMYEMELSKRKIQILAYRNQINPHFLYNTFDCIRGMALYYDAEEIAEITMSLSEVFRYAIKGENVVLVEEEVNYIREYAKIVEYRFSGHIRINIQVDEDVKKKKMIKLLLQPLVENAVFHGVEKCINGGNILVKIQLIEGDFIQFSVEDNGCGMSKERKKEVLDSLEKEEEEDKKKGIGLSNIYGRLKLFYDETARFSIESTLNVGTKVVIAVPEQILGEKHV